MLLMAWNEVIQLFRIRTVVLMLLGLPLLLIFLLGNALESDYKPVKLSIYAVGSDPLGDAAVKYLTSSSIEAYVSPRIRESEEEVREDLRTGRADYGIAVDQSGLHYYPGKFTERNMIVESNLKRFVADVNLRQSAAIVLPELSQEQISRSGESASSRELVQIGNLVARDSADFNNFSALQYYSVAYLIMFLLYSGMTGAISLSEERDKGTLLRLYAMPVSLNAMLFGKLMGVIFFAFIQAAIIVLFTKGIYGVDWGGNYGGIALICVLVSMATVCFAVILASFIRSRRAIDSIFSLLILVMTFLSGGMISDLGPTIRQLGKFTLNHWANEALRTMMAGGTWQDSWHFVAILSVITALLLGLSIVRFRKAVALA
ncbi:ABC transporter permease [Cohnella herbarum]|uniref:ABC transporter permease n=1 Tax=Cohnella herbarum TaxID=2728023 RepID=UPI0020C4FBFF|nr:ABC transporter permease [Cohnella herbarum]